LRPGLLRVACAAVATGLALPSTATAWAAPLPSAATALAIPRAVEAGPHTTAVEVTDSRGVRLRFPRPVERVVCLIESALSGLYMLGAESVVVGVPAQVYTSPTFAWYARLDERVRRRRLPVAGSWDFISLERVLALRPDVVLIWAAQREAIAALEERGVAVFAVFIDSQPDLYGEVLALGALSGTSARARQLVSAAQAAIAGVTRRLSLAPARRRPSVYYSWSPGELETSCGQSTVDELITLAGGRNVCGSLPREHLVAQAERLLVWNPEVIVLWPSPRRRPADVLADPRWRTLRAVQRGAVYELPEAFVSDLWTLKVQHTVKVLAKRLHPDLFSDLDLEADQRAMLRSLYGARIAGHGTRLDGQ